MKTLLVSFILLLYAGIAYADCWYDGRSYETGTIINGYVCTPGGTWKSQNGHMELWEELYGFDVKK